MRYAQGRTWGTAVAGALYCTACKTRRFLHGFCSHIRNKSTRCSEREFPIHPVGGSNRSADRQDPNLRSTSRKVPHRVVGRAARRRTTRCGGPRSKRKGSPRNDRLASPNCIARVQEQIRGREALRLEATAAKQSTRSNGNQFDGSPRSLYTSTERRNSECDRRPFAKHRTSHTRAPRTNQRRLKGSLRRKRCMAREGRCEGARRRQGGRRRTCDTC